MMPGFASYIAIGVDDDGQRSVGLIPVVAGTRFHHQRHIQLGCGDIFS